MVVAHRERCVVGISHPEDRAVLAVVSDAPKAGLGCNQRLVAVIIVGKGLGRLGDVDAARHGREFVRAVGWRRNRGSGASYRRAQPPAARTRRRGGNGERRSRAHGVARSHCRILYHISRDEITVRTKSDPPRNLPRRSFSKAGLPHNLPRPSPSPPHPPCHLFPAPTRRAWNPHA